MSKEELKGRQLKHSSLASFFTDKHFDALKQALDGSESTFDIQIEGSDELRYFKVKFLPLVFDGGGRAVVIIFEDTTDIKKYQRELEERVEERTKELVITNEALQRQIQDRIHADEALRESEEKYRRIVETANEGILVMDKTWSVTFANRKLVDIFGYSAEEIVGHDFARFMFPEDIQDHLIKVQQRVEGLSDTYERRFRHKDGSVCWMMVSASPILDTDRQFCGSFAMLTDITDRKRAEEALCESEDRYRTLVENANEAIFVIQGGRICFANPKLEKITRYAAEELTQKVFLDFVHPDDRVFVAEQFKRRLSGEIPTDSYTFRIVSKEGSLHWMEINSTLITWNGDSAILVLLSDITERKKTEEALHEANKEVSLLTSITRHDILNQLSMLAGYISLLKEQSGDENIAGQIQKMETIADTIHRQIVFTRIYEYVGLRPPQWKNIKITISSVLKTMEIGDVSFVIDTDNLEIYVNYLIEKVFFNLIENALRHGKHVTRIHVSYQQTEKNVILVFEDDGIGIPVGDKDQIFARGAGKETGNGLFLCREILGITGITIRETGEPGKGARFEATVPEGMYRFEGRS